MEIAFSSQLLLVGGSDWPDLPLIKTITLVHFTAENKWDFKKLLKEA